MYLFQAIHAWDDANVQEDMEELENLLNELKDYEEQREMEPVDDQYENFDEETGLEERADEVQADYTEEEINAMLDANQAAREKAEMERWAAEEAGVTAEKELEELDATVGKLIELICLYQRPSEANRRRFSSLTEYISAACTKQCKTSVLSRRHKCVSLSLTRCLL